MARRHARCNRSSLIERAIYACILVMLMGCGTRQERAGFRDAVAMNLGVDSARTVHLKHKDLGRHITSLKNTRFDFLSKKTPRKNRLKLSYKSFGIKSIDAFNRSATVVLGQFRYLESMVGQFYMDSRTFLKHDLRKIKLIELDKNLRVKSFKKTKTVRLYRKMRGKLRGVLGSFKHVYKGVKRLRVDGARMIKAAPGELRKDKRKAIYMDAILNELSNRTKALASLAKRSKKLGSRIQKMQAVMSALSSRDSP